MLGESTEEVYSIRIEKHIKEGSHERLPLNTVPWSGSLVRRWRSRYRRRRGGRRSPHPGWFDLWHGMPPSNPPAKKTRSCHVNRRTWRIKSALPCNWKTDRTHTRLQCMAAGMKVHFMQRSYNNIKDQTLHYETKGQQWATGEAIKCTTHLTMVNESARPIDPSAYRKHTYPKARSHSLQEFFSGFNPGDMRRTWKKSPTWTSDQNWKEQ